MTFSDCLMGVRSISPLTSSNQMDRIIGKRLGEIPLISHSLGKSTCPSREMVKQRAIINDRLIRPKCLYTYECITYYQEVTYGSETST